MTRPAADCKNATPERREPGSPRGILRHEPGPGDFHHARVAPAPELAAVVQHFWIVRWKLQGHPPQIRETLPHPNVHAVVSLGSGDAVVHGVHSGRFRTVLDGDDGVFGIKFRPGAFRSMLGRSVSSLRDRVVPLGAVLPEAEHLPEVLRGTADDDGDMVRAAERFLESRCPAPDEHAMLAGRIVDGIAADRQILRVEQALDRWPLGARQLQRLFSEYVGVGPKWVINRYRLHEALERLAGGAPANWAQLALDLGYFDQAHFIRDFKAMTGRTPSDYVRIGADPGVQSVSSP